MNLKRFASLKEQYKKISIPAKAAFWFTVCNVLQKGISMITVPLFTRMLTTDEYGLFSVYQSWYSIIGIFVSLNLQDAAFNTGMIKYKDDKDGFTFSLQSLTTCLALFFLVIYLLGMQFWNSLFELPTVLMLCMFMELFFIPAFSFWSARQKFEYKYVSLIFFTLLIAVLCPTVAVIAIKISSNKGIARIMSFTLVQSAIAFGFYILNVHKGKGRFSFSYWKYAVTFSIPLIPHYLSMSVLQQSDRIMISRLISTGSAAIYSIAYNISQIVLLLTKAINNSFVPYTYRCLDKKQYNELRHNSNFLLIFITGIMCAVMLVGPELVKIFATSDYYDAIWIIPPVSVSVYFMFVYPMFSNVEFYYEKSGIAMRASVIAAIANILLNFIFIPMFGFVAAGYTTVVCYIILTIMHYREMNRVLISQGISEQVYNLKVVSALGLFLILLIPIVLILYNYTAVRYIIITIMILIVFCKRDALICRLNEIRKK